MKFDTIFSIALLSWPLSTAFVSGPTKPSVPFVRKHASGSALFEAALEPAEPQKVASLVPVVADKPDDDDDREYSADGSVLGNKEALAVRAPLKWIGPYACLALRFPELATPSQKERNVSGIALDFALDTAANLNTINPMVATELGLEAVGAAPAGIGTAGVIQQGITYMLGTCQLELPRAVPTGPVEANSETAASTEKTTEKEQTDEEENSDMQSSAEESKDQDEEEEEEEMPFMMNLTASALPGVPSPPGAAGLLSLAFLHAFEGGVEFVWGVQGDATRRPAITFFASEVPQITQDRSLVKIEPLPVTMLPSVTVRINGVDMPALLDTGSPVTVLNAQAAKAAGVETVESVSQKKNGNFFSQFSDNWRYAQAAQRGDVLSIMSAEGRVDLLKTVASLQVNVLDDEEEEVSFGDSHVFVGDLPGLAALNGIGVDSPPAVVLGMDVLRTRPSMLIKARSNEVYFE